MQLDTIGAVLLAAGMCIGLGRATTGSVVGAAQPLSEQTRNNLDTAMHGEALAYAKYLLYAQKARQEGHPDVAQVFEQAAQEERFAHFAEEAQLSGLVGTTLENLQDAMRGEAYEMDTMYPRFSQQARAVGDAAAAQRFEEISRDEKKHHDRFEAALGKLQPAARGVGGSGDRAK